MNDIIIKNGIVITMNSERSVLEDGAIVIRNDRIAAIGTTQDILSRFSAATVIDAFHHIIMPGLIDAHAHAGHTLVKTLGADLPDNAWNQACFKIYQQGSDEEFWYADALLSGLERLKCGTTTSLNMLGGGDMIMRSDSPVYGEHHCDAIEKIGIREFLAVGPCYPPFPRTYSRWDGDKYQELAVTFEQQLQTTETLIQKRHRQGNGRLSICVTSPTIHPAQMQPRELDLLNVQSQAARAISRRMGVLFTQDGHRHGSIEHAFHNQVTGPDALFSHSIDLTEREIAICQETNTRIVHNPSAIMSMIGRCPVTELLDAGVTVLLGSDGTAPDRSYDMFRHMFQCMRYHRAYFHDPRILPPGKVLEMVTIDAARGLGMEHEIGSLEPGKKADIILIDLEKPHFYPLNMPLYRTLYYANGSDVDTVIVDGQILMQNRIVNTVIESDVLSRAQKAAETAIRRAGVEHLTQLPERFWGHTHF